MNVQYISDKQGKAAGVFIPIEDWEEMVDFYGINEKNSDIPEWQKNIIRERVADYKKNPDTSLDWNEVKDSFKFD